MKRLICGKRLLIAWAYLRPLFTGAHSREKTCTMRATRIFLRMSYEWQGAFAERNRKLLGVSAERDLHAEGDSPFLVLLGMNVWVSKCMCRTSALPRVYIYIHAYIHKCINKYIHMYIRTDRHIDIQTYKHTKYTHTYTHPYISTYLYTNIRTYM